MKNQNSTVDQLRNLRIISRCLSVFFAGCIICIQVNHWTPKNQVNMWTTTLNRVDDAIRSVVTPVALIGKVGVSYPDVPPLRLEKVNQNVYPVPVNMVTLMLVFEKKVTDVQTFTNRMYERKGVSGVYSDSKGEHTSFKILFDPGFTDHATLFAEIYEQVDDPALFN